MNDFERCVIQNFASFIDCELSKAEEHLKNEHYALAKGGIDTALQYVELLSSIIADHQGESNHVQK